MILRKYTAILMLLLLVGCSRQQTFDQTTTAPKGVLKLITESVHSRQDDGTPIAIAKGEGTAFAVSPNVIVTAAHNIDGLEISQTLNGQEFKIIKKYRFGGDGLILVVDKIPVEAHIYDYREYYPNTDVWVMGTGYPGQKPLLQLTGKLLNKTTVGVLYMRGMSGGPVTYNDTAIGLISAIVPDMGVSVFVPLDYTLLYKVIVENAPDATVVPPVKVEPEIESVGG